MKIETVLGKQIDQQDLDVINEYRKLRLHRARPWDHAHANHFHDRLFFLVRDADRLVAFCTLRPLELMIEEHLVAIQGLQAVISIEQGKGYGKVLMQAVREHIAERDEILVGFCEPHNRDFYIKSGLEVFPDQMPRFVFINELGVEYTEEGDVLHYCKSDTRIRDALNEGKKITHTIPHW